MTMLRAGELGKRAKPSSAICRARAKSIPRVLSHGGPSSLDVVIVGELAFWLTPSLLNFSLAQNAERNCAIDLPRGFCLDRYAIRTPELVVVRPQTLTGRGVCQPCGVAGSVACLENVALKRVCRSELLGQLSSGGIRWFANDDSMHSRECREICGDFACDAPRKLTLPGFAAFKREHCDGRHPIRVRRLTGPEPPRADPRNSGEEDDKPKSGSEAAILTHAPPQPVAARTRARGLDLVDVDRPIDVLERLFSDISQRQAELAEDRVAHGRRNADAGWLRGRLEPRRDIDPVAVSSRSVVNDVAKVDADAQQHSTIDGNVEIALGDDLLNRDGAFHRAHGARELRHDSIARDVYDRAAVLRDERQDDRLVRFEVAHRLFFVAPHKARVTSDIRSQDGSKPPFVNVEPLRPLCHDVFPRDARGATYRGSNQRRLSRRLGRRVAFAQLGRLPIPNWTCIYAPDGARVP